MTTRDFDPHRLDVPRFAKEGAELNGRWLLAQLARVAESASDEAPVEATDAVEWSAHGEARPVRAAEPQAALRLKARAALSLVCQRCLSPVPVALAVDRIFLFVHGEDSAALLDEASEEDVLAMTRSLDLQELIEDELLLALPLVPRHEVCPTPLNVPDAALVDDDVPNAFAALANLRGLPRPN